MITNSQNQFERLKRKRSLEFPTECFSKHGSSERWSTSILSWLSEIVFSNNKRFAQECKTSFAGTTHTNIFRKGCSCSLRSRLKRLVHLSACFSTRVPCVPCRLSFKVFSCRLDDLCGILNRLELIDFNVGIFLQFMCQC